jgi:hypothetical protein
MVSEVKSRSDARLVDDGAQAGAGGLGLREHITTSAGNATTTLELIQ